MLAAFCEDLRVSPRKQPPAIPDEPNTSEQPHDVLAAEEFAMPAPEAARHGGPIVLPQDPSGETEPHDILAAEEFAMPAPPPRAPFRSPAGSSRSRKGAAGLLAAGLGAIAVVLRRRRSRRR